MNILKNLYSVYVYLLKMETYTWVLAQSQW
jgi:hypothetical protein